MNFLNFRTGELIIENIEPQEHIQVPDFVKKTVDLTESFAKGVNKGSFNLKSQVVGGFSKEIVNSVKKVIPKCEKSSNEKIEDAKEVTGHGAKTTGKVIVRNFVKN